jgi:hypothetical protein
MFTQYRASLVRIAGAMALTAAAALPLSLASTAHAYPLFGVYVAPPVVYAPPVYVAPVPVYPGPVYVAPGYYRGYYAPYYRGYYGRGYYR